MENKSKSVYHVLGGLFHHDLGYGGFTRVAKLCADRLTSQLVKDRIGAGETHVHLFIETTEVLENPYRVYNHKSTKIVSVEKALEICKQIEEETDE